MKKLCTLPLFDDNRNGVEDWDDEWCLILQHYIRAAWLASLFAVMGTYLKPVSWPVSNWTSYVLLLDEEGTMPYHANYHTVLLILKPLEISVQVKHNTSRWFLLSSPYMALVLRWVLRCTWMDPWLVRPIFRNQMQVQLELFVMWPVMRYMSFELVPLY